MEDSSGARGIGTFSTNIGFGFLPDPESIAHEGLINDYYFETLDERERLFKTSYACAASKDPFSGKLEHYVVVNTSSCFDGDGLKKFGRPSLNLTILLDISGSMGSPFAGTGETKTKLEVAQESILTLLSRLKPADTFALLAFDTAVDTLQPLSSWDANNLIDLKHKVVLLQPRGGTDIAKGMEAAARLYATLTPEQSENENRIIILTDAELSVGNEADILRITHACADKKIYTTFIGVGIDFNTKLVSQLASIRAQNYLSVKSSKDFKREMEEEFDYLVTPVVFNATVTIKDTSAWQPVRVFGSPGFEIPEKGKLFSVNTSFPSPKESPTSTKGGAIVVKLKPKSNISNGSVPLVVTYEDRKGNHYTDEEKLQFPPLKEGEEYYQTVSARKAILLIRYANFMKFFLQDCRSHGTTSNTEWKPSVDLRSEGIPIPHIHPQKPDMPQGSIQYTCADVLKQFAGYMEKEMDVIQDRQLQRELKSLLMLLEKAEKK